VASSPARPAPAAHGRPPERAATAPWLTPAAQGAAVTLLWETAAPYEAVLEAAAGGGVTLRGLRLRHASPSVANNAAVFCRGGTLTLEVRGARGRTARARARGCVRARAFQPCRPSETAAPRPPQRHVDAGVRCRRAPGQGVHARAGRWPAQDCDVESATGSGVLAEGGWLALRRCALHDCRGYGAALLGAADGGPGARLAPAGRALLWALLSGGSPTRSLLQRQDGSELVCGRVGQGRASPAQLPPDLRSEQSRHGMGVRSTTRATMRRRRAAGGLPGEPQRRRRRAVPRRRGAARAGLQHARQRRVGPDREGRGRRVCWQQHRRCPSPTLPQSRTRAHAHLPRALGSLPGLGAAPCRAAHAHTAERLHRAEKRGRQDTHGNSSRVVSTCLQRAGNARGSVLLGAYADLDAGDVARSNSLDRPVKLE